jgi:hypothetical protein
MQATATAATPQPSGGLPAHRLRRHGNDDGQRFKGEKLAGSSGVIISEVGPSSSGLSLGKVSEGEGERALAWMGKRRHWLAADYHIDRKARAKAVVVVAAGAVAAAAAAVVVVV